VSLEECAALIARLASENDLVLVEGAGGLLVRYRDGEAWAATLADLAGLVGAPLLVVAQPWLGTLNQSALTLEALDRRRLPLAGIVLGSWPAAPDRACRTNLADLETLAGQPLAGVLPEAMARLSPADFAAAAAAGLGPRLGGRFDAADFRCRYGYAAEPVHPDSREPS
jgi:dethiobiotin synthetase